MVEEWGRELVDAGPLVAGTAGWWVDQIAPGGDALDDGEKVADLGGFKGSAVDAGLVEEGGRIEDAAKLKAAPAGEHGAQLRGALLLLVDPSKVSAGFEREDPGAAEGRKAAVGDVVTEAVPLQGCCA